MERVPIRYARSGDVNIAYQVTGEGPFDLVLAPGFFSHLELDWEHPAAVRMIERLSSFSRLLRFDKRGTGLSDRSVGLPDFETRMDDVRAVMDAIGSERAGRGARGELGREGRRRDDGAERDARPRRMVRQARPRSAQPTRRARPDPHELKGGRAPRETTTYRTSTSTRSWTSRRLPYGHATIAPSERVLATVLFTDLVGSTDRARELGDRAWADLLERHHVAVRRELARFGCEEIHTAGDGFLALGEGPTSTIRCALAVRDAIASLGLGLRGRAHGRGRASRGGSPRGIAVHVGARVAAAAGPDEVLVSSTTADLVAGSGIVLEERGEFELKGVGRRALYAATA